MAYFKENGKWKCESGHAVLGPSSASRWVTCPGSIFHSKSEKVSEGSDASNLGTAVHEVGELCLKHDKEAIEFLGQKVNGFIMGKEEITNASKYVSICRKSMETASVFGIEFNSKLNDNIGGTVDFYSIDHNAKVVDVKDYKNGRGFVEAQGNMQMGTYAIGIIKEAKIPDINNYQIRCQVVQPRIDNIATWVTSVHVLRVYSKLISMQGAKALAMLDGTIPVETTGSAGACRWCSYRFRCPDAIY